MKTWLSLVLLVFLGFLTGALHAIEADWQPVNVDGREYLTFENVAKFYDLKLVSGVDPQRVTLTDARRQIETLPNSRELNVNGVRQWLAFPVLQQDGNLLISRFDLAKTVEPCLRPTMICNLEPFQTVVLDAGHGGQDGGGHTLTGFEKDYTLDVIRDLKSSLEAKGLNVVLTRDEDAYLSLERRAELANAIPNAIFVSVHFNSGEAEASGLEVYAMTPRGAASTSDTHASLDQLEQMPGNDFDNASFALANCVHHAVLGTLGTPDRGVKRARFAVLRLTHAPSILVEGGFMTSGVDSREITNAAWRRQLAEAIVAGVRSYQGVVMEKQPPKLVADYRNEQLLLRGTLASAGSIKFRLPTPDLSLRPVSNPRPASRVQSPAVRMITVPVRRR